MTTRTPRDSALPTDGPRPGSLESRASVALKLLAALNAFAILLAMIPGTVPSSRLEITAFHFAAGALSALYVVVAWSLDRRRPWAVATIRPLLVIVFVWGAYGFVTAFAAGAIRIPFAPLTTGWALFGGADQRPLPALSRSTAMALLASVALIGTMLVSNPVFGWGGVVDVHAQDLNASLVVDCGPSGSPPPERVRITYEWTWSNTTLLPNDEDVVFIGWNGTDAHGRPLYFFDAAADAGTGIQLGSSTGVSAAMVDAAAAKWRGRLQWKIDLSTYGIRPGRIELVLVRAAAQPRDPQPLTVGATYVHVGVWQNDAPAVTCSW